MKRIFCIFLILLQLFAICSCVGNYAVVNLNDSIAIPHDGIIKKEVFEQIKSDNAIASFVGEVDGIKYEWTVFGSDISDAKDVNLSIGLTKTSDGIKIRFYEAENFEFPLLLSVFLNEKWDALGAEAYCDEKVVCSVSLTGSKNSILNISIKESFTELTVIPYKNVQSVSGSVSFGSDAKNEKDYLSDINDETRQIYSNNGDSSPKDLEISQGTTGDENYLTEVKENTDGNVYRGGQDSGSYFPTAGEETQNAFGSYDDYLSESKDSDNRVYSDGKTTDQDKYLTDPVPEGKPLPVEPENQEVNKGKTYTCTFSIECSTILNNLSELDPDKLELVPSNGVILAPTTVTFYEGESVFDVLQRVCKEYNIHLEFSFTPVYNSAYIEGIHNLYEFDCGALSGWMYRVNGWYPNYGCSRYQLADKEVVEWRYTCNDLGKDIGCDWMG